MKSVLFVLLATSGSGFTSPRQRHRWLGIRRGASNIDIDTLRDTVVEQAREISTSIQLALSPLFQPDDEVQVDEIVQICDQLDDLSNDSVANFFKIKSLEFRRYELLAKLMRANYDEYVATAGFLSPSRMSRLSLPNLQDVPVDGTLKNVGLDENGQPLLSDCELEDLEFKESPLDKLLLKLFRDQVERHTGGVASNKAGLEGLLEQGRTYMLQSETRDQHEMVKNTLGGLMTPYLPPFYRIFMSGIIPKADTQLGPWFYAPWLTSLVTPIFFGFLVGPSYVNRRKDGHPGGLVVEKCKFLQESSCKGMCLNICKIPAQEFFDEQLGLPLTVSPNFVTQECQWSFGEKPLPVEDDLSFPRGCLNGCTSRTEMAKLGKSSANLCK